jgi:addiction module HigA family antidote
MNNKLNKKNNEHAGILLNEEFVIPMKLSLHQIANAIDVDASRLSEIIKGKVRISADMDYKLTQFFELSQGYFLRIQQKYDMILAKNKAEHDGIKITKFNSLLNQQVSR